MPYATLTDLIDRFSETEITQLADPHGNGMIDDAYVERALADAAALVDGHLAGRYPTLPLDPVPPIITGYVCDLARARLYTVEIPEHVARREKDAIRFLELVGQGKLNLGAHPEPASGNLAAVVAQPRRRYGVGL